MASVYRAIIFGDSYNVYSIATRRTVRHLLETLMDLLNAFFVFNLTATVAMVIAFCLTRDGTVASASKSGKRFADLSLAGATGAATSMVLLASVATLFQ